MIKIEKPNQKVVYVSTTNDCGDNKGGLFCMVHNRIDNDEYFDYFTISKKEYKEHKDNIEEYIAKEFFNGKIVA